MKHILYLALLLSTAGFAAERQNHVNVELIPEYSVAAPGDTLTVLFHQTIDKDWHTYWRNPGDSGAPPTMTWELPDGVTLSDFRWPYPERIAYGPLMNFGYHDTVSLPMTLTIPDDFNDDQLQISGSGSILVCADICIPERLSLSLSLPIGERVIDASRQHLFTAADQLIPTSINAAVSVVAAEETLSLNVKIPMAVDHRVSLIEYFPYQNDLINNPGEQPYEIDESGITLTLEHGWDFNPEGDFSGILVVHEAGMVSSFAFNHRGEVSAATPESDAEMGLLLAALFAFLGGLILNLMPCVFPVLSIKILSLVDGASEGSASIRLHGWVYAAGVVLSFVAIAAVLLALRYGGESIGWGFQLQSPLVVGLLAYLFLLIGLNLMGVFEIGTSLMSVGGGGATEGYAGSFSTGVLATVVAAPCTAPFMGAAVGFALTQSPIAALLVFASLGFGMAVPYLALCYSPALLDRLPRPGNWMVVMKQVLAFPMFASAIWLLWVLGIQTGATGMMQLLGGCLGIAFAVWLLGQAGASGLMQQVNRVIAFALFVLAIYIAAIQKPEPIAVVSQATDGSGSVLVQNYSKDALQNAVKNGPVFVNFTAAWCITCKVNELNALSLDSVQQAFEEKGVTYMKGDWTNEDPVITEALAEYGRSGVPLYLLYREGADRAEVLPQILTEGIVLDALDQL